VSCCSNSGEILIVPRRGGPGEGMNREQLEDMPPLPQDVASSWEAFFGFSPENEGEEIGGRVHEMRSRPYVAAVEEDMVEEELRRLRADPRVAAATRNWRVSPALPIGRVPDLDIDLARVVHFLAHSGVAEGHPDATAERQVRVAVLDSGVAPSAVCCERLDPHQIDAVALGSGIRSDPYDPTGHGSAVAAVIHRIAPQAQIVSVRCFGPNGCSLADIVYGSLFTRLLDDRVDVINMSFSVDFSVDSCPACGYVHGGVDERAALRDLFGYLRTELDTRPLLVAAAGNDGGSVAIPAALDGVVAAGSTGGSPSHEPRAAPRYEALPSDFYLAPGGTREEPVTRGRGLHQTAPFYGTSLATAVVSGRLARMLGEPAAHGIPVGRDEAVWECAMTALRQLAWQGFPGYSPATHGIGVLR
jgi:Subtilase family